MADQVRLAQNIEESPLALRVTQAGPAADGIQLLEFRALDGADLPAWTPGAHIAIRVPNGAMRTYSLCSDPHERDRYVVAVKRDAGGRGGSISLVDGVKPGDVVQVMPPRNLFALAPAAPSFILVAGGIGITPLMSMIRHLRAAGGRPFHLYYLTRNPAGAAFLAELATFGNDVTLHHDGGDPDQGFDLWPVFETPTRAHIYCCGPGPLMEAVRDMTGHWPEAAVHFEDFGADLVRPRADDVPFMVQLGREGPQLQVPVGASILETIRAHGRAVPSSCESGTCGTCRTAILQGEADHRDRVLDAAEKATAIMICVSRAKSPVLVLDL